jgi:hypothetical protein
LRRCLALESWQPLVTQLLTGEDEVRVIAYYVTISFVEVYPVHAESVANLGEGISGLDNVHITGWSGCRRLWSGCRSRVYDVLTYSTQEAVYVRHSAVMARYSVRDACVLLDGAEGGAVPASHDIADVPECAVVELAGGYEEVSVLWVLCDACEAVYVCYAWISPPIECRAYSYETTSEDAFVELVSEGYTFRCAVIEYGGAVWDCLKLGEAHGWAVVNTHYFTGASGSG